jgi:mRNA-degrading endonuclease toxin of MazEF toxin-antitoxin module
LASNRVGEIVFLDFPYTNFKNSKIRPAVILGQSDIDQNDYIVAYITSEVDNYIWSEFAVSLKACDLSTQTLKYDSVIRVDKIIVVNRSQFLREKVAYLTEEKLQEVLKV